MKPGVFMNTLGKGEYDPIAKIRMDQGALTDEQIADIVAYLRSLK
jgi:mono/diheme cytochrome c family protein